MAKRVENLLIKCLPPEEREAFTALLLPVSLPMGMQLFQVAEPPRYVHFITSGIASIVTSLPSGEAAEVAIVGSEGFPEAVHMLGPQTMDTRCFMQINGTGLRLDAKRFREEFAKRTALHDAVLRLVQCQSFITLQLAACNRLHNVDQRLARWLLMVSDRVGDTTLRLTQEFLAEMIGARRATVTVAAGQLQRAGCIQYSRGVVKIIDRPRLETTSCDCYPITRKLVDDLYR